MLINEKVEHLKTNIPNIKKIVIKFQKIEKRKNLKKKYLDSHKRAIWTLDKPMTLKASSKENPSLIILTAAMPIPL